MIGHLAAEDRALVVAARELVEERYLEGRHEVAAAVRMRSCAVHLGLHVESSIGRASICAEGIAIADASGSVVTPVGGGKSKRGSSSSATRGGDSDGTGALRSTASD